MSDFLMGLLGEAWLVKLAAAGAISALGWLIVLVAKKFANNTLVQEILDHARTAMNNNYRDVILPKIEAAQAAGSPGGAKITSEERMDLLRAVWDSVLSEASGPAKSKLLSLGKDWLDAKVEDILLSIKAKAAVAKPPAPAPAPTPGT